MRRPIPSASIGMVGLAVERIEDKDLVTAASEFAMEAHADQRRKYTGELYIYHCDEVANILRARGYEDDEEMIAAAYLHDTVEDTYVTNEDLVLNFGPKVAWLVEQVTDVSRPEDGNRKTRKAMDRDHLAKACARAQTIKVADLISNTQSITEHDPNFAKVYMREKRELLEVLTRADPALLEVAWSIVHEYEST